MKAFRPLLLIVLFAGSLSFARPWTPDDDAILGIPVDGVVTIHSQTLGIGHLKIDFTNPNVKMESVELNKHEWTLVTIDGETRLWETGRPELPSINRAIRLPNTGNVQLIITPGEYNQYDNIDVLPQQSTDLKPVGNRLIPTDYAFDSTQYNTDSFYPSELAKISEPQIMRDARVALLGVQPVQYNPVTKTLRVYQSIDIETIPIGGTGDNELLTTQSHAVPSFAGLYSEVIGALDLYTDAVNAAPGKNLIICRSGEAALLQPFADWKTQSGHPTQIVSTSLTTGASIHDSIIVPAYNTFNPPLETVLLIGDGGNTGDYLLPANPNSQSDHSYSILGTSILASWWVGRMSCNNASMLQTILNRTLNYERIPYLGPTGSDTAWYNYGWGYAGTGEDIISNPPCIRFCLQCMRERGVTNLLFDTHFGNVDQNLINTRLSGGALFWAHRAAWIGEISNGDVANINNTNKPWVGINISCDTGDWFGTSQTGMQESVTQLGIPTAPKGALSSISTATSNTNPAHNNVMAAGTFYALGYKNARIPAPMYFEGKYQMWRNYWFGDQSNAQGFIRWNNPMGDLTVNFWTGVPQAITTNAPTTLGIGQNRLELQVFRSTIPISGVMVTAWKKNAGGSNETYTRVISDDSGRVVLTLTNATAGMMLLTVVGNQVGQNLIPIIDTIQVLQSATDLSFSNYSVRDDTTGGRSGNNNSTANPGETIDLSVQLINRGNTIATGITGTLVSTDSRVSVTTSTSSWNDDSAGVTVGSITPFRVHLAGGFRDNDLIPLRLTLSTSQGARVITVPLTVRSIRLAYVSCTLNPATINPGQGADLTDTVRNNGGLATGTTNAVLFSLSPYLTITTGTAVFTGLPIGSNASNPTGQLFHFTTSGRAIPGTIANLGCVFNSGLASDTVYFSITIGTRTIHDPTGPDPYGYMAYDITDIGYSTLVPTYSWVEIIPALGGTGTRLGLNDFTISTSATADTGMVVRLPFTARYYGVSYDSATICSNGWLAFGAQRSPDAGHNPYNNSRNWHLPAQEGPKNMVAVNWCEQSNTGTNQGVYVKNDTANHRYIVTWKTQTLYTPTGQEYQLIVSDPNFSQTPTGDSPLKMQYKSYTPTQFVGGETGVSYSTIGIADSTYTRGIEYVYWNQYTPGSAAIVTGSASNHAIMFTTAQPVTGNITGTVVRTSDNQPLVGASVLMLNGGRSAVTDSSGHYSITNLQIGNYRVQAALTGYNTKVDTVTILDSVTSTLNFALTAPGLRISVRDTTVRPNDSIYVTLLDTGQTSDQRIFITNTGNGALTWNSTLLYGAGFDELDSLWNPVFSFNATTACNGDQNIWGVEYDGANFWLTGSNNLTVPYHLYKLDHDGHLLRTFNCPATSGGYGWRDLAFDGRYLYGSYSNYIDKIDTSSGQVVSRYSVSVNPARALAIDTAGGVLYYADQGSPIYKLRLSDGGALGTIPNPSGGGLYGLAWFPFDTDTMRLYAFVRDSLSHGAGSRIYKINTTTNAVRSMVRLGTAVENAAGLAVTSRWNPLLWTVAAVLQSNGSSRISLFELSFNSSWISYHPLSDSLAAGRGDTVNIHLDSRFMTEYRYRVAIRFSTNSLIPSVTVPIVMNVLHYDSLAVSERNSEMPRVYSLEQNYPNPFNATTTINFTLPVRSDVRLTLYDALGRQVSKLLSAKSLEAGHHSISWNGARLTSGIYFYRFEAGSYSTTKKMLLMK